MEASVVDLRHKMKEILEAVDRNETVTILYHGKPRARLVAPEAPPGQAVDLENHPAFGMWKDHPEMGDVQGYVRRIREGRHRAI